MRHLLLFYIFLASLISCHSDDIKPKQLKGKWKHVSGTYENKCVSGCTGHTTPSMMAPFDMEISDTEIHRIAKFGAPGANDYTHEYTIKGKVLNCTDKRSGRKFTITINELTDGRLSWHQDDIENNVNYTLDMVHSR